MPILTLKISSNAEASGAVIKRMKLTLGDRTFKEVVANVKSASATISFF